MHHRQGGWRSGRGRSVLPRVLVARLLVLVLLLWFLAADGPQAHPRAPRTFGLTTTGVEQLPALAQLRAAALGRHLDVLNFFEAWVWDRPLPVDRLRDIVRTGTVPEITWEPWDPRQGLTQPAYRLETITAGSHDAYLLSWARSAAAFGQPLLLRFGHEMNGIWYPWSTTRNGGSARAYIAAYRHVHDLFRAAGAGNVRWVWSPATAGDAGASYPGNVYVDLVGVDGYNGGTELPDRGGWLTAQQIFGPTLAEVRAVAPGKPVWVNETGSSEDGGSKAAWISGLFRYLETEGVSGLVWFDIRKDADWRIATSPQAEQAFTDSLRGW